MGNEQSVKIKDNATKKDLDNFMNEIKTENQRLKETTFFVLEKMDQHNPRTNVREFAQKYFESNTKCSSGFIMAFSKKKQDECLKAKMEMFESMLKLVDSTSKQENLEQLKENLEKQASYLDRVIKENTSL